uniref:NADH:ubiquinone reductase (H(+)-translocating) n=1 Tax=Strigamia maritima TaxID=126957 RepID=T1JHD4_STRMM
MWFSFLTGFYSKEPILEHVLIGGFGGFVVLVLLISFGLTACYSIRLVYYLMAGSGGGYSGVILPLILKLSGVGVLTLGGLTGLLIGGLLGGGGPVSGFFGRIWYLPDLRGGWSSFIFLVLGGKLVQVVDVGKIIVLLGILVQWGQDNIIKFYLFIFFLWVWFVYWVVYGCKLSLSAALKMLRRIYLGEIVVSWGKTIIVEMEIVM